MIQTKHKNTCKAALLLLLALLSASAAMAETLTVFNSTNYKRPFVPMFVNSTDPMTISRSQIIYSASEIGSMTGGYITALTFYTALTNITGTTLQNVDIYLTSTNQTSISEFVDPASATSVFHGTVRFEHEAGGSKVTINFSTPYFYNGGNLLIGCEHITNVGTEVVQFWGYGRSGASINGVGPIGSTINPTQRNFIPMTTFTYIPSVTIGAGTTPHNWVPFALCFNYSLVQQIYLAEEIGMAGSIKTIAFEYAHSEPFSMEGVQICLKHTDKNKFENNSDMVRVSESDKVFEGTFSATGAGWVTITLDTPFEYDGTSNLLLCCYDPTNGRFGNAFRFYSHWSPGNKVMINASDNSPLPPLNNPSAYAYGNLFNMRSNIRFGIIQNIFPIPTNISVSELSDVTATMTWTNPQTSTTITGYTYQYKKASDANWSAEITTTNTSASLSGLLGFTEYQFRVKTLYGSEQSVYAYCNFTTAMPLPYDCGFENGMAGWRLVDDYYAYTTISSSINHEGAHAFRFMSFYTGEHGPQYLISPRLAVYDEPLIVSFYYYEYSFNTTTFQIGYSTTINEPSAFIWVEEVTSPNGVWTLYEHTFPVEAKYIAISFDNYGTSNVFYLDDFNFIEYSPYPQPTGLTTSNMTDQNATLTWNAPETDQTVTGYAYQYRLTTDAEWSTLATVNTTSVTISGLSANTYYKFRVKALYSGGHASNFETITIFTEGETESLPHYQGFENGMGGWRIVDGYAQTGIKWGSQYAYNGNCGFEFTLYSANTPPQYLISPRFDGSQAMTVSFYYKGFREDNLVYVAAFQVGFSTTTKDLDAFTWGDTIRNTYFWQQYTDYFPEGTKYVAVKWVAGFFLYLDDFSFEVGYPFPTDLAVCNLTDQSATLTWSAPETDETITGYAYQYKLSIVNYYWSDEVMVDSTSVTLNGLSVNTTYDFRVRALYAGDNASIHKSTSFLTEGVIESPPYYQGFEDGMGGWRIVNGGQGTGIVESEPTIQNYIHNGSHSFGFHLYFDSDSIPIPQYLISPQFEIFSPVIASFYYTNFYTEHYIYPALFQIGISTTTKDLDAFIWGDTITSAIADTWEFRTESLPVGTKYVAIKWVGGQWLFLDDFSIEYPCDGFFVDAAHPFTENFVSQTFPPRCWENPSVVVDGVDRQWIRDWFFYHYDSGSAYSSRYGTTYLKLPGLHLSDNLNAAQLSFWSLYTDLSNYATCSLVLLDGDNETELWTPDVGTLQNEVFYETHIDLSAYIGQTISLAFKHEGNNNSTWSIDNVVVNMPWLGEGTEQNPYIINSVDYWNYFCDCLQDNDLWNNFSGKYVKLDADITVTRMAGSAYHDFKGTFDGQGHTLTLAYGTAESPVSEEYAAPFLYVENGANIRNLHVDGHIYTSNKYAGGIVGSQWGTVNISNCRSSVVIHSSKSDDGTHGGIVANQCGGALTMSGCIYDGRLLTTNGTTLCGGLVGYHNTGTCTISDCLYTPAEVTLAPGESYITDGATFCRNYNGTPANCYYTETMGDAQGQLAHSITSENVPLVFAGETTEYDVSGITSYGTGLQYDNVLYAGNGEEVNLNLTIPEGFSVVAVTYTPEDGTATEIIPVNGLYSFTMPNADVVINTVTEYLIHNATEWNNFCDALQDNSTYNRFSGRTVKLAADITVTRMAGSSYHDFKGTFDGQGHTLTIAYGSAESPFSEEYSAPFRYVENGANIHNLHVDGHIYTSNKFASGIAGCQYGTVNISNCRSSVIIHSSVNGDGTHSGIVAVHHNTLNVSGCLFDGRLLTTNGTTLCGGFIGWRYGTCTLSDCLYAPATEVTLAPGESYITNGATFCRNNNGTLDNCYYTETLSTTQGKLAHSITSGEGVLLEMAGEATEYNISGITSYGTGIMYDSMLYAGNGDEVNLTFPVPEGFSVTATYTPEGGTATEIIPVNGVYSFTMPDVDVVINAVTEYLIHNATEWNNFCDALQDNDTYNRFIGRTVKLCADISVTRMAGSDYHDFMGTFDGQGHTLTVAYGTAENPITEEYAAPFRNVENGCVIENLHVDGTITTANKFAAGIVAQQYGAVTIRNCRSSVTIQSSVEGDGTHGGLVGVKGNSNNANLTIEGCTFDGKIVSTGTTATTLCGGFVGWRSNSGSLTITNSLYAPTADNNAVSSGATFARNWTMPDDANCYYTETMGTVQGKLAIANPAVSPIGEPTATYDVSDLAFYSNGVQFVEVFYYDPERNFLRPITGYGTGNGGWQLIASPVAESVTPTADNGFLANEYDLYRFNPTHEDNEWENYKVGNFNLENGKGYIYANNGNVTLVFSGTPYNGNGVFTLVYDADDERKCWNLVGNPFTYMAYLDREYYVLNANGTGINPEPIPASVPVQPCTAVFVKAVAAGETVVFSVTAP